VATTRAVGAELADAEPARLVAVTTERIVCPTSEPATGYVLDDALPMLVQLLPELSQSCQA
jgi:hypothetical protein